MRCYSLFVLLFAFSCFGLRAQEIDILQDDRFYFTSGGEMLFSFAAVDYQGSEQGTIMRWAPVFNPQVLYHYDHRDYLGFFAGLSLQNVGFIMDLPDEDNVRKKFRTYNLGIPLGVKFGVLERTFLYAGLSLEFPFNYKEKTFIDGDKEDKTVVWFSDRNPTMQTAIFLGYQFPEGISLKFKYYLSQFFNQSFTTIEDGVAVQPYRNFEARVFYFGLSFKLFRNKRFIHQEKLERIERVL